MSTIEAVFAPGTAPESLSAAALAVDRLGSCSADYDGLTDAELLAGQRDIARARAVLDTRSAWAAKAVARRSRPELGQAGLAKQQGFLTPDALIQDLTGSTKAEARKLVDVGRMLDDTETAEAAAVAAAADARDGADPAGADPAGADPAGADPAGPESPDCLFDTPVLLPWHAPISHAVTNGTLSVAQAHAIRTGLGDIDTVVTTEVLAGALVKLLTEAPTLNVDELLKRSRKMRDQLDEAGIAVREKKAWDDRYLRIWTLDTGQVRINGLFPPEQGETIIAIHNSLTGPRRGGVQFVDPDRAAWAQAVKDDPRSTDQLTADGFIDLVKAGGTVNPNRMLGGRTPAVRILKVAEPTGRPAVQPVAQPAAQPVLEPTGQPAAPPVAKPDAQPVLEATGQPVAQPAAQPVLEPTGQPVAQPVLQPTGQPVAQPAAQPVLEPTGQPVAQPVLQPTGQPVAQPAAQPVVQSEAPLQPLCDPSDLLVPLPGGTGHGYLEGNDAPVSLETIERVICDSGTIDITFDTYGQPLDVGREERLFTPVQRIALAARDGGCRWLDCAKPPSMTEAHHIEHWHRDRGRTDLRLGVLLCNAHHRLLHNQGWQILEHRGRYWLRPPATVDPGQSLIELLGKGPATG